MHWMRRVRSSLSAWRNKIRVKQMGKLFFQINNIELDLTIFDDIYSPLEDSYLIAKNIPKDIKGKKVLDIGCGSGVLSIISAMYGADVTAVDINEHALKNTEQNAEKYKIKLKLIESDLFDKVEGKFDLILLNPPYVPSDEDDKYLSKGIRYATTSGMFGHNLTAKFLRQFKKHLNKNGKVLLVISSHNNIKNKLEKAGWKEIDSDSFFFEKIFLMEFKK